MILQKANSNRLANYLTAGLGAGCLAGQADAAITVSLYGPGAQSPLTTPATPAGFDVGIAFTPNNRCIIGDYHAAAAGFSTDNNYFTNGSDHPGFKNYGDGQYTSANLATQGATLFSNQNYANITFNGSDGVYEAVAQFYLTGNGTGYLVAIARNSDNSALSISAGKAAIDAIPEPSALALLALGAGGLLARRKRSIA